jgi:hypothetical protein
MLILQNIFTISDFFLIIVFDGIFFENIEKIGAYPPIINLKNAIKQNNQKEIRDCKNILKNQHP